MPFLAPQQERTQRRAQRQSINRRQDHGDRDRYSELAVQLSGDAGQKGDRKEDRHKDECNGDHGA